VNEPESAIMYAKLITSLMSDYPEFKEVMVASFYRTCPFLVPFCPSQFEGQSDKDYYRYLFFIFFFNIILPVHRKGQYRIGPKLAQLIPIKLRSCFIKMCFSREGFSAKRILSRFGDSLLR
jgi:hypothetical protein